MASSSENQGLQIAVIIFALLTIIMSGATFYVFKLSEDAELRLADATKKQQQEHTALTEALKEIEDCHKWMGTKFVGVKADEAKKLFDADMATHANTLVPEKQAYSDALEDLKVAYNTLREELAAERIKVNTQAADVATLTETKNTMIDTHRKEAAAAQGELTDTKAKFAEERGKLNADKQQLSGDLNGARATLGELQQKFDTAAKKSTDDIAALVNLNKGKQEKLDELEKKDFVSSDGEITWVSPQTKTVWINVGRDDGLKQRVTFSIYGLDQNGVARGKPKGSIEVTQILGAHLAEARILEDKLSDPILIRDQLYTPLWHAGRQELFAICGIIDVDGDKVSDVGFIKDLIRRNGGDWVAELQPDGTINTQGDGMTINTRYLIQGQPIPNDPNQSYGKMLEQAEQLGVEVINLEKFMDYVGWKETSKVVQFGRDAKPDDFYYDPNQNRANRPRPSIGGDNNFRRRTPPKAANGTAY